MKKDKKGIDEERRFWDEKKILKIRKKTKKWYWDKKDNFETKKIRQKRGGKKRQNKDDFQTIDGKKTTKRQFWDKKIEKYTDNPQNGGEPCFPPFC